MRLKKKKKDYAEDLCALLRALVNSEIKSQAAFEKLIETKANERSLRINDSAKKMLYKYFTYKDENADIFLDKDGNSVPDPDLRDYEYIPRNLSIDAYYKKEIYPFIKDSWIDESKSKELVEIPFMKSFVHFDKKRNLKDILNDINHLVGDKEIKL